MRKAQVLAGVAVVLLVGGIWVSDASAHVTPDPATAPKGAGDQAITFRVPNEMDNASTVTLEIQLPQDHPIAEVDALDTPGWTSTIETRHLDTPIKTDDGSFSDVASVITWKGGSIGPGEYGDFKILAMGLPTDTDALTFKAVQTYDDGQSVSWIETDPAAEHPAAVVALTAADSDSAHATTNAPTEAAATASKTSSNDSSKGLAIGAVVVAAVALLVAAGALLSTRRPKPATAE